MKCFLTTVTVLVAAVAFAAAAEDQAAPKKEGKEVRAQSAVLVQPVPTATGPVTPPPSALLKEVWPQETVQLASGSTINQNCTYIRNPGFPSAYTGGSNGVSYTVQKCTSSVCYLRLDFESFNILGTTLTTELNGGVCKDTFIVTTNTKQDIPTICGQNTGQHMYIDIGRDSGDTATLAFTFGDTTSSRNWEIKVTQVLCGGPNTYVPPTGCLQYQTGLTGRLTTFNFIPTNDNHLAKQDYSVCIRQEAGYCCIQYTPCTDVTSPFSLDVLPANAMPGAAIAQQDSVCTGDYVEIDGSSATCNQGNSKLPVINKYCGGALNAFVTGTVNDFICDCTQPFQVTIHTDSIPEVAGGNTAIKSRGACLTWKQIPCGLI